MLLPRGELDRSLAHAISRKPAPADAVGMPSGVMLTACAHRSFRCVAILKAWATPCCLALGEVNSITIWPLDQKEDSCPPQTETDQNLPDVCRRLGRDRPSVLMVSRAL